MAFLLITAKLTNTLPQGHRVPLVISALAQFPAKICAQEAYLSKWRQHDVVATSIDSGKTGSTPVCDVRQVTQILGPLQFPHLLNRESDSTHLIGLLRRFSDSLF